MAPAPCWHNRRGPCRQAWPQATRARVVVMDTAGVAPRISGLWPQCPPSQLVLAQTGLTPGCGRDRAERSRRPRPGRAARPGGLKDDDARVNAPGAVRHCPGLPICQRRALTTAEPPAEHGPVRALCTMPLAWARHCLDHRGGASVVGYPHPVTVVTGASNGNIGRAVSRAGPGRPWSTSTTCCPPGYPLLTLVPGRPDRRGLHPRTRGRDYAQHNGSALVNNAGATRPGTIDTATTQQLDDVVGLHLRAPMLLVQAFRLRCARAARAAS